MGNKNSNPRSERREDLVSDGEIMKCIEERVQFSISPNIKRVSAFNMHQRCGPEGAKVMVNALTNNSTVDNLYFVNNSICDEGAKEIAKFLQFNTSLNSLNLSLNKIGLEGMESISEALCVNTTLTKLSLANNCKGGMKFFPKSSTLQTLDVGHSCEVDFFLTSLVSSNPKNITSLNLEYNEIGIERAQLLSTVLTLYPLKELNINGNPLRNEGVLLIAKSLKVNNNNTLNDISLYNTEFEGDDESVSALVDALEHNKRLEIDIGGNPLSVEAIQKLSQFDKRVRLNNLKECTSSSTLPMISNPVSTPSNDTPSKKPSIPSNNTVSTTNKTVSTISNPSKNDKIPTNKTVSTISNPSNNDKIPTNNTVTIINNPSNNDKIPSPPYKVPVVSAIPPVHDLQQNYSSPQSAFPPVHNQQYSSPQSAIPPVHYQQYSSPQSATLKTIVHQPQEQIFSEWDEKSLNLYSRLNKDLSSPEQERTALAPKWKQYLYYLFSGLKIPFWKSNQDLYRGVSIDLVTKYPNRYVVGNTITWYEFTSTTTKLQAIQQFLDTNSPCTIFTINSCFSGRAIHTMSAIPNECEVLIPSGSRFEVLSVMSIGMAKMIQLKQIPTLEHLFEMEVNYF